MGFSIFLFFHIFLQKSSDWSLLTNFQCQQLEATLFEVSKMCKQYRKEITLFLNLQFFSQKHCSPDDICYMGEFSLIFVKKFHALLLTLRAFFWFKMKEFLVFLIFPHYFGCGTNYLLTYFNFYRNEICGSVNILSVKPFKCFKLGCFSCVERPLKFCQSVIKSK